MAAEIEAYSASPDDEGLMLRIVCAQCNTIWGWASDVPAAWERLEGLAGWHNRERHGHVRVAW